MKAKSVWRIMAHNDDWAERDAQIVEGPLAMLRFVVFPRRAVGAIEKSVPGKWHHHICFSKIALHLHDRK